MADPAAPVQRILLVDDHERARQALRELLEELDPRLSVETVSDGTVALRRCADDPPDVVLLDYRIPGGSASDTIAILNSTAPAVPVIVLTGDPNPEVTSEVIAAGAVACVGKAANIYELLDVIRTARPRA